MTSKWVGMVPDHWSSDEIGLGYDPHKQFRRTKQDLFKFSFKVTEKACPFSNKGITKFQMSKFKRCTHRYCFDLIKETTI